MRRAILGMIPCFLLMAGCALFRPAPVQDMYEVRAPLPSAGRKADGPVLMVRFVNVAPAFADSAWVYRVGENRFESDYYRLFLSSPSEWITREMKAWLRGCGLFSEVTGLGSDLQATHLLEVEVSELYGDFREGVTPAAVMAIHYRLLSQNRNGHGRLLTQGSARMSVPLEKRTPEALVTAWGKAFDGCMQKMQRDLAQVMGAR